MGANFKTHREISKQNNIRVSDVFWVLHVSSVWQGKKNTKQTKNTKFKLVCHWSLFIPKLLSETGRASENEPKSQLKTAFFFLFAGSCLLKDRVKLPSRFNKKKEKRKKVMKLWWFPPFSTNIRSRVDDDRNLWKFHQSHDNDAQAHRTLAATLDIWPCDGRVPLSKEKRKEKSTETKPDRVLPSTVPFDVCMSSSPWGRENTQPPLRFRLCLGYDLLTSDPFKLCRGSSHRPGGGRRTPTFSTELLGDVSTHQCAPQFASCIIWVSAPELTLSLSCATNCRELTCPCWSPGIFRVCLANASCFVP